MKQEKFTEQANEALALSQEMVRQYQHGQWDVEHILLALLQQESGLVGDILVELGANVDTVKQQVMAPGEDPPSGLSDATNLCYAARGSGATDGWSGS